MASESFPILSRLDDGRPSMLGRRRGNTTGCFTGALCVLLFLATPLVACGQEAGSAPNWWSGESAGHLGIEGFAESPGAGNKEDGVAFVYDFFDKQGFVYIAVAPFDNSFKIGFPNR